jgi:hypothetical protein
MSLHFKKAKAFVATVDGGTRKFLAQPGFIAQTVPDWVADTATFRQGLKDGSIVNLTPPQLMPGYRAPKSEPVAEEPDGPDDTGKGGGQKAEDPDGPDDAGKGDSEEQAKAPEVPFGGQPLTPAQPPASARIGQVRAGSRKG